MAAMHAKKVGITNHVILLTRSACGWRQIIELAWVPVNSYIRESKGVVEVNNPTHENHTPCFDPVLAR